MRALNGSSDSFLFADPAYSGPAFGATVELALATVTVASINANRTAMSFAGMPPGFALRVGDRLSIPHGTDRQFYSALSSDGVADGAGKTGEISVFPYLPFGVAVGFVVELVKPTLKVIIPPSGYTPFTVYPGPYAAGASITMPQKP